MKNNANDLEKYMDNKLLKVGKYNLIFNDILGINISDFDIYRSKGLPAHMLKRHHEKCLKYIDYIPDIIQSPDYIGINPNETEVQSIELIKRYRDNILIGIKLEFAIISFLSSIVALINDNPKSMPESTFDLPKLLSATRAVILSKEIFTFDKFLKPSIKTA